MPSSNVQIWPVVAYGAIVFVLVTAIVVISYLVGQRHRARSRDVPYESGIQPTGFARAASGLDYYMVALFFLVFDIEAAFVIAWAVAFHELGWPGYVAVVLFIATLVAGLVYIWKLGALDTNPETRNTDAGDTHE